MLQSFWGAVAVMYHCCVELQGTVESACSPSKAVQQHMQSVTCSCILYLTMPNNNFEYQRMQQQQQQQIRLFRHTSASQCSCTMLPPLRCDASTSCRQGLPLLVKCYYLK